MLLFIMFKNLYNHDLALYIFLILYDNDERCIQSLQYVITCKKLYNHAHHVPYLFVIYSSYGLS